MQQESNSTVSASKAVEEYCPLIPSQSFADPITVTGHGFYEYRINGNGEVADGGLRVSANGSSAGVRTFTLTIEGRTYSWTSPASYTPSDVANALANAINADNATNGLIATATTALSVVRANPQTPITSYSANVLLSVVAHPAPNPIQFAEVRVKSADGSLIQCAETDATGRFSFQLPKSSSAYEVSISSRGNNSNLRAYVMNNPNDNSYHSISTQTSGASDVSDLVLVASATGSVTGGAFNILDQIRKSNDYLRSTTSGCNQPGQPNYYAGCEPFTVAPLIFAYWSRGISPGVYFGISGGISFYIIGQNELYLMGGNNGDVDFSDTDHFDNSVIIHEYGHFLEDRYASPNSPGGSHNGNSVIDPRLAWGEGWANFFQAAVTGNPVYRDTYGNVSCNYANSNTCTGAYFNVNLQNSAANLPPYDIPTVLGEGNFREFSVARLLWSVIDPTKGAYSFALPWTVFSNTSFGLKGPHHFRSIGTFHKIQTQVGGDWTALASQEKQRQSTADFGAPLINSGTSCAQVMQAVKPPSDDGSFARSNQFFNNDFFYIDHPGGNLSVELTYDVSMSGPPDLDLYLYRDGYTYGSAEDMSVVSNRDNDGGTEVFNTSVAPGPYILNVMAFTGKTAGAATTYNLRVNGQIACPNP